jgi:hypothetical protein
VKGDLTINEVDKMRLEAQRKIEEIIRQLGNDLDAWVDTIEVEPRTWFNSRTEFEKYHYFVAIKFK